MYEFFLIQGVDTGGRSLQITDFKSYLKNLLFDRKKYEQNKIIEFFGKKETLNNNWLTDLLLKISVLPHKKTSPMILF